MGSDKALSLFAGIPLVQHTLNLLATVTLSNENRFGAAKRRLDISIAGSRTDLSSYASTIPDTDSKSGPLGGVFSALKASGAVWNLFLPVDMPLIPASLLNLLFVRGIQTGAPVVATKLNGRLEPFPVLLNRGVLPHIADRLSCGQTAPHLAWKTIPTLFNTLIDSPSVENLLQAGYCGHPAGLPPAYWYQSANAPADLAYLSGLYDSIAGRQT